MTASRALKEMDVIIEMPRKNAKSEVTHDLSDIIGQEHAKRAVEVASVGGFNILFSGSPGCGKTMLANTYADILTKTGRTKSIHVSVGSTIKSLQKDLTDNAVIVIDDLPEIQRSVMLYVKELAESHNITMVATMQPCPCGSFGNPAMQCACTPSTIMKYRTSIPAGGFEMFDISIELLMPYHKEIINHLQGWHKTENTETILHRLNRARARYVVSNIQPDEDSLRLLEMACQKLAFSVRAVKRALMVSKAIADLEGSDNIRTHHVAEAIQYRAFNRQI